MAAAAPGRSFDEADRDTESCLSDGRLLKKNRQTLAGITGPELYTIECGGVERRVVVKRVDKSTLGVERFEGGTWEVGFSDSYRYERAAYLLDRELGMDMVPVAVIRKVDRQPSALIEFIDHARHEQDSPHAPSDAELEELARKKGIMALFDALIFNTDRNRSNWLVDDADWRLYLIDHSRAFRTVSDLPETYAGTRTCLPAELYERLRGLRTEPLIELLGATLSKRQITTIVARRDKLVESIEVDRQRLGDDVVICRPPS